MIGERGIKYWISLLNGIPCLCDKPLTVVAGDLPKYQKFMEEGLLYTGSGLRFAYELDTHRFIFRIRNIYMRLLLMIFASMVYI